MFAFVADNFFEVQKYMVLDGHIYTVMALMTEEKYTDVTALEDTAGIRRVVVGRI